MNQQIPATLDPMPEPKWPSDTQRGPIGAMPKALAGYDAARPVPEFEGTNGARVE